MRKIFSVSVISILLASVASARADVINTFTLSTPTEDGSVHGVLEIDVTTGKALFGEFTLYLMPPAPGLAAQTFYVNGYFTNYSAFMTQPNNHGFSITENGENLYLEVANSLVGYMGGPLCGPTSGVCIGAGEGSQFTAHDSPYYGGTIEHLSPANLVLISSSVTPEPESLVLAGSGMLSLAALVRRRRRM